MFTGKSTTPNPKAPNGIYELKAHSIGGIPQWMLIRGTDQTNPLLLILHGGPGASDMMFSRAHEADLEHIFTVVHWDRRGTGKSYRNTIRPKDKTMALLNQDIREAVKMLCERFGHEKLFLMGHSFGSVLGLKYASKYPERLHAYIGVGQFTHFLRNFHLAQDWLSEVAEVRKDRALKRVLQKDGKPELEDKDLKKKYMRMYKGLLRNGSILYKERNMRKLNRTANKGSEYKLWDYIKLIRGIRFSLQALWTELTAVDLFREITRVEVPCHFIYGEADHATDPELGRELLDQIKSPKTGHHMVEKAAHFPQYEQADLFAGHLNIIKTQTQLWAAREEKESK